MTNICVLCEGQLNNEFRRQMQAAGLQDHDIHIEHLSEWSDEKEAQQKVIVTVGANATKALLPNEHLSDVHCYVYQTNGTLVIPVYSPDYVIRGNFSDGFWIKHGLWKAKKLARGEASVHKKEELRIHVKYDEVLSFLRAIENGATIAVDIEKTKSNEISCISFAGEQSMSIPFIYNWEPYWSKEEEINVWKAIQDVLANESIAKIFQNALFDILVLSYFGVEVSGTIHDTMTMAHLISPELGKGLADIGRLYVYAEAWKNKVDWKNIKDWDEFWEYNALDSAYTRYAYYEQINVLSKLGLLGFYEERLVPLVPLAYKMCAMGWNIDTETMSIDTKLIEEELLVLERGITEIACTYGFEKLNPRSPKQLKELFQKMGFQLVMKKGKETTNEMALIKMEQKYKHKVFSLQRQHRTQAKFMSSYLRTPLDTDGRYRFQIIIPGTVESRWSSSQTPWDTGGNSQNIPKAFRKYIIPDEGKKLINVDLQRADAHVVAWISKEPTMSRLLESGTDIHVYTANSIFGDITKMPKDEFDKRRALGKQANHALNYGMQALKFAISVLQETGIALTQEEAQNIIDGYFRTYPAIKQWHQSIQGQIRRTQTLTSPHGRVRRFLGWVTDDMFREGYSWIPPTTVTDSINETLIRFSGECQCPIDVLGQCHDSLLIQTEERFVDEVVDSVCLAASKSVFVIHGIERVIPCEVSIGYNWKDMVSLKKEKV